jgi:serine phosphatase RsbU (regulator of sigma subunit)
MSDVAPDPARLLARVMRAAARERPALLARAVNDVAREFGFRDIQVLLVDLHQHALRQLGRREVSYPLDSDAGEAFRTQRTVSIRDGATAQWFLPLHGSAERLGVLSLTADAEMSDDKVEVLDDLASLVGELVLTRGLVGDEIALTRRSRDLSLAAELRWMLLPPLTVSLPEVAVSGILEPAYDIAGDTFDYALGDHRLELAILDAVGHGLPASQLASFAVAAYRNLRRRGADLEEMLREMDRWIGEQFGQSGFVTGQLAELDVDTGQMWIVNAGHPPPLLLDASGVTEEVECQPCPPLGLGYAEGMRYDLQLAPGDAVLFYSDGIVESRSPDGTFYGLERTGKLFAELVGDGLPTAEIVRQMVSDVLTHETTDLRDDATLVLVHWLGPPASSARG